MRRVEATVGAPGMLGALTCIFVLSSRIVLGDEPVRFVVTFGFMGGGLGVVSVSLVWACVAPCRGCTC